MFIELKYTPATTIYWSLSLIRYLSVEVVIAVQSKLSLILFRFFSTTLRVWTNEVVSIIMVGVVVLIMGALAVVPATLRVLTAIVLRWLRFRTSSDVHAGVSHASKRLTNKALVSILSTTCLQLLPVIFVVLQFDVLVEGAFRPIGFNRQRLVTNKITTFVGTNALAKLKLNTYPYDFGQSSQGQWKCLEISPAVLRCRLRFSEVMSKVMPRATSCAL